MKNKRNGVVNEGIVSTRLGLKESQTCRRAANLQKFISRIHRGKLHIPTVSTAKSVQLIEAKAKGLNVSCSVAVHHLVMTDEKLEGFDTRFKVSPHLRTEVDRKLLNAVLDNTIDMITSDHNPVDIEHKKMEFDMAKRWNYRS
jgi:dihydroorotase